MKLSAKAEYACIAMVELASKYPEGQPVQVRAIAEAHGVPQRFLVLILLQLKAAGLVASSRGNTGGYQLARAPDAINLAEVIRAIDRSPQAHGNAPGAPSQVLEALHNVWHEVNQAEEKILERTTLAMMVQRAQESHSASYQI